MGEIEVSSEYLPSKIRVDELLKFENTYFRDTFIWANIEKRNFWFPQVQTKFCSPRSILFFSAQQLFSNKNESLQLIQ
jgi:hypothetical protein